MADTVVGIGADLGELRRELAKLPNLSADAAQKTLIKVEKAVSKAEQAAKRAAGTVKRAARAAERETEKRIKSTADGLKGLFEIGGGSGEVFEKLGHIMAALSNPVGVAAVGLGSLTLGLGAAAAGAVGLIQTAEELVDKLEPVEGALGISDEAVQSIERANDALRTVSVVGQQAVLLMAAELAPAIEEVAVLLVKLGLAFTDQLRLVAEGEGIFHKAISSMGAAVTGLLLGPLDGAIATLTTMVAGLKHLAEVAGANGLARQLDKAAGAWDGFKAGLGDKVVDKTVEGLAEAIDNLDASTADYDARARELIGTIGKLDDEARDLTDRLKGVQEILFLLADASRSLRDQRALASMLDEVDTASARSIRQIRELHAQVDNLVPPQALAEVDQLQLLLFDLEQASIAAGGANALLAENIERVKDRIEQLNREGTLLGDLVGALNERFPQLGEALGRVGEVGARVFQGLSKALDTTLGLVTRIVQGFLRFVELAGGLDLTSLFSEASSAQAEGGGSLGAIASAMIAGASAAIGEFVGRVGEIVEALVGELPGLMRAVARSLGPVTDALLEGVLGVFDVLEGEEPRILKLVERLAAKLVDFISSEGGRLVNQALEFGSNLLVTLIRGVPGLVDAILQQLPFIIIELLDGVGEVVTALIAAIPEIIASIIANLPAIVQALIMAIPQLILEIIVALTKLGPQITIALTKQILLVIARIREVVGAELDRFREQGVVEYVRGLWNRLKGRLKVWIRELFFTGSDADSLAGLGDAAQQAFNDTPGPVRAGMRGLTARFAPGDTVIAAKDTRELMRQAQAASGSSGGGSRVVLDLQDGHLAFERMFKRSRRSGGELSKLLGPDAGQVKVYG